MFITWQWQNESDYRAIVTEGICAATTISMSSECSFEIIKSLSAWQRNSQISCRHTNNLQNKNTWFLSLSNNNCLQQINSRINQITTELLHVACARCKQEYQNYLSNNLLWLMLNIYFLSCLFSIINLIFFIGFIP